MSRQACCSSPRTVNLAIATVTLETLMTQSYDNALPFFLSSLFLLLSAGIRLIWLIYWPLTMSDCVKCGGPRMTSDSKHTGVGSVTVVSAGTPCRHLGPVGPSRPAASTPSLCFHGRSVQVRSSLLALQELTPGSLNGPRPEASLAPGPIKRSPG